MDLQELRKIRQGYLDVQLAIHKRVAKTFDPGILEVARRRLDELQLGLDHLAPVLALLAGLDALTARVGALDDRLHNQECGLQQQMDRHAALADRHDLLLAQVAELERRELKRELDDTNKRTSKQHYALERRLNALELALHKEGLCSLKNEERLDELKNETAEWIDALQGEDTRLSARLYELSGVVKPVKKGENDNGDERKFLLTLRHREITLQHYELDAQRTGDTKTEAKAQELLVALRANIKQIEEVNDERGRKL